MGIIAISAAIDIEYGFIWLMVGAFLFYSDCFNDCFGLGLGTLSCDCIGSGSLVGFWFNENLSFSNGSKRFHFRVSTH